MFAAASLAGPLESIAAAFEEDTGVSVRFSYGGSSTLARQVAAGAPADIVILANDAWMDHLAARGRLTTGTQHTLLHNSLVVIGAAQEPELHALVDLPETIGSDRLALALSEAVPAGIYARAALENLDIWDALRPQIVEADNVRAALSLVAIGAARFGIVYATDAGAEPRVRVLAQIPEALHPPIRYPVAAVSGGDPAAEQFIAALMSLPARTIFTGAGFEIAP